MYGNYEHPEQVKDIFKSIDNEDVDNLRFYITDGADPDMRDADGFSLLIRALLNKKYHAAETLLEMGANPDLLIASTGQSALHYAAGDNNAHMIGVLAHYKANLNLQDGFNWTPLHMAASHAHLDAVQALVEAGADLSLKNSQQQRPLEIAVKKAAHEVEILAKPYRPVVEYLRAQMEDQGVEFMTKQERQAELDRDLASLKSRDPGRFKLKM